MGQELSSLCYFWTHRKDPKDPSTELIVALEQDLKIERHARRMAQARLRQLQQVLSDTTDAIELEPFEIESPRRQHTHTHKKNIA